MRNKVFKLIITLLLIAFANSASAQQTARERLEQIGSSDVKSTASPMSVRASQASRSQPADIENARWSRTIYRYLDLNKEGNSPLYFPIMPENGRMNLFSMIFRLIGDDKIGAYEYLDGRELFTEEYRIDFIEFLDRFGVYYQTEGDHLVIDDVDIPSNEVQGYFVKEVHYLDSRSSDFKTEVVAICPVIHRQDDYDVTTTRYPLFWIPYSDIRPYALGMPIMSSSLNNSMLGTVDDFFRKRSYDGEIYKAANPRNLAVAQYAATPEDVVNEQQKIEQELMDFKTVIWHEYTDSTKVDVINKKRGRRRALPKVSTPSPSQSSGNSMRERRY